ncbi:hypothetical protein ACWPM1_11470 [Tsuneonella sp. HG249]
MNDTDCTFEEVNPVLTVPPCTTVGTRNVTYNGRTRTVRNGSTDFLTDNYSVTYNGNLIVDGLPVQTAANFSYPFGNQTGPGGGPVDASYFFGTTGQVVNVSASYTGEKIQVVSTGAAGSAVPASPPAYWSRVTNLTGTVHSIAISLDSYFETSDGGEYDFELASLNAANVVNNATALSGRFHGSAGNGAIQFGRLTGTATVIPGPVTTPYPSDANAVNTGLQSLYQMGYAVSATVTTNLDEFGLTTPKVTVSEGIAMNGSKITGLAAGTAATDAVNKGQLDAAIAGAGGGTPYLAVGTAGNSASATGANSLAVGPSTTAGGVYSSALGTSSSATGEASTAVGGRSSANALNATAVGYQATAGEVGTAVGMNSFAAGAGTALGTRARTTNADSGTALGYETSAGFNATAVGASATATGAQTVALGTGTNATATNSIAIGRAAAAQTQGGIAIGAFAGAVTNDFGIAIGNSAQASGFHSSVVGNSSTAGGNYSLALGHQTSAAGSSSIAIGSDGDDADSKGAQATAAQSMAIGPDASATGVQASAVGVVAAATAEQSNAFGFQSGAFGYKSTAVGSSSRATEDKTTAVGERSEALAYGTVAVGLEATAAATANYGTSIGAFSQVAGANGTAVGYAAQANHANSTTVGYQATSTAANQVTLGGAGSAVRIGDVTASTAAQVGPVDIVTVDANGTLGRQQAASAQAVQAVSAQMEYIAAVTDSQFSALSNQVSDLSFRLDDLSRSTSGGIAAAMALGGTIIVPDSTVSVSVNASTYRGEQGYSGVVAARLAPKVYVTGGVAGSTAKKSTGARVGMAVGF